MMKYIAGALLIAALWSGPALAQSPDLSAARRYVAGAGFFDPSTYSLIQP